MSLSPLNRRSHRQGIATVRSARKSGKPPARYLRLWEAIQLTRAELSDWQQRSALIDKLFRQHILPRETQLTHIHGELTERLMDAYAEGWLGNAEQALLHLWISENLQSLADHPFAAASQKDTLNRRWQQLLAAEADKTSPQGNTQGTSLDELFDDEPDEDDTVFDFGWHNSQHHRSEPEQEADSTTDRHEAHGGIHEQRHETASAGRTSGKDNRKPVKSNTSTEQLEQRLSVEHLFRQLARALHPDREQDDARKAEKHELMSECLAARKNKDINTLLSLYCEHIGELPDELSGNEQEELIEALQQQLRQLQNELRQERFGKPLQAQIIQRYSAVNDEMTRQLVLQHADSLDLEVTRLQDRLQRLHAREALLTALIERREIEQNRMSIDNMTGYSPGR